MPKKTKREWIEWFNSLDDDVEIDLRVSWGSESHKGKLKKVTIYT